MADPTADQVALADQAKTILGPALAGVFVNLIFYGVSCTQTYYYYVNYRKDKKWMKVYVAILAFLDGLTSVLDMVFLYHTLINQFGEESAISKIYWPFQTNRALTGLIGTMVQAFFAWRVYVLTRNKAAACIISAFALAGLGASLATTILLLTRHLGFDQFTVLNAEVSVWLGSGTACDIIITILLVWYLRTHRTGFQNTDDILDRIIRLTIQTGALTSTVAILDLSLFIAMSKDNGYHLAFNVLLSKLYINTLLSSLNTRRGWFTTSSDGGENQRVTQRGDVFALNSMPRPQVFVNVESHRASEGQFQADDGQSITFKAKDMDDV